jgi:tetratricopeptide (TPR) repeat protein
MNQAIHVLDKAVKILPDRHEVWTELARYHYYLQSPEGLAQAAQYIDKALAIQQASNIAETDPGPRLLKAEISLQRNNPQEAYQQASIIRRAYPENAAGVSIQVRALEALGLPNEALELLVGMKSIVKQSKELQLMKAVLLGQCQDCEAELAELQALSQEYPYDFDVLSALVRTLSRSGSIDEAIQVSQTALQNADQKVNNIHRSGLHYLLGEMLSQIGQLDQAIHHFTQAISYQPQNVEAYLDLGKVYQRQRQHKKAQKTFHQAIQVAPGDARPYVQAATSYKEGKDYQAAEEMLRRAVELAPHDVSVRKQLAAIVAINLVQNPNPVQTHMSH